METDKENTSSYLQTSFQSPAVNHYDRCNAGSASRASTMRPLTSGMRTAAAESEVTLIHLYTVFQKKGDTKLMAVTLSFLNRFSKFFH